MTSSRTASRARPTSAKPRPGARAPSASHAPAQMRSKMRRRGDDSRATLERRASRRSVGRRPDDVARREGAARPRAAVSSISRWGTSCQTADEPSPPLFSKRTATDACVDFKSSIRLQCENMRRFRRELFCRASRTQREQSIRPKISRIDFDLVDFHADGRERVEELRRLNGHALRDGEAVGEVVHDRAPVAGRGHAVVLLAGALLDGVEQLEVGRPTEKRPRGARRRLPGTRGRGTGSGRGCPCAGRWPWPCRPGRTWRRSPAAGRARSGR